MQTSDSDPWDKYSNNLSQICADIGYEDEVTAAIGIIIPTQDSVVKESEDMREEIQDNYDCPASYDDGTDYYNLDS